MAIVNRDEIARRVARKGGYHIGDVEDILKVYEDVLIEAVRAHETVHQGKVFKLEMRSVSSKVAWDGINRKYYDRKAKYVPKFQNLSRLKNEVQIEE